MTLDGDCEIEWRVNCIDIHIFDSNCWNECASVCVSEFDVEFPLKFNNNSLVLFGWTLIAKSLEPTRLFKQVHSYSRDIC